jgi:hypothetical protein
MPNTETIARVILRAEQKCKTIMEQARKRESAHLEHARTSPHRKAHYLKRAAEEIELAEQLCKEMMERAKRIKAKSGELMLKKLLGE